MRDARVAEWFLSLVLPTERAASAVGDWLEDASERGHIWFWSCVFRTVFAHVWSDLAESPRFMVSLGLRGWLFGVMLTLGYLVLLIPVTLIIGILVGFGGLLIPAHFVAPPHTQDFFQILGTLTGCVFTAGCQFQTGRWIARRAPRREMAACIASWLAPSVLFGLLTLVVMHFWSSEVNQFLANHPDKTDLWSVRTAFFTNNFPSEVFLFAGAFQVRRKASGNVAA